MTLAFRVYNRCCNEKIIFKGGFRYEKLYYYGN